MAFAKVEYCPRCGTVVSVYFEPDDPGDFSGPGVWYHGCSGGCTRADERRVGRAAS